MVDTLVKLMGQMAHKPQTQLLRGSLLRPLTATLGEAWAPDRTIGWIVRLTRIPPVA